MHANMHLKLPKYALKTSKYALKIQNYMYIFKQKSMLQTYKNLFVGHKCLEAYTSSFLSGFENKACFKSTP